MTTHDRSRRAMVPRPAWLAELEQEIAARVPLHPNLLSAVKLLVVAPLLLLSLRQVDLIAGGPVLVSALFGLFAALDYLDGVVARGRGLETSFGRIFDRVTDYPLLIALSYLCVSVIPLPLLIVKVALDVLLLVLFACGRGSTQNRLRTAMSYSALFSLLALSQGWLPALFSADVVRLLLCINAGFSAIVALYNLDVLPMVKSFVQVVRRLRPGTA